MAMNTPYLSEGTTHLTSNLTVDQQLIVGGAATLSGALNSASAASFGALTATTATLSGALASASAASFGAITGTTGNFSSSVTIGGGTQIRFVSASSSSLVATTAVATKSTETTIANNLAAIGDLVIWGLGTSTSSLSAGLALDMFVSAASVITVRLSNCSAANAAQPAISLTYGLFRF